MGRDKRHPQDTPRNETMTFDIENTIRNKKQKGGARHAVKENMAGLSATSISRIIHVASRRQPPAPHRWAHTAGA